MKKFVIFAAVLLLSVLGAFIGVHLWHRAGVAAGQQAMEAKEFGKARIKFEQQKAFAFLESDKWKLDYLIAMAYLNDPELDPKLTGEKALPILRSIPKESEYFAEARVSLAKNWFLLLAMPKKAEGLCLEALAREPDNLEAKDLLFTIYSATNDPIAAHKIFWSAFPDAPEEQKVTRFQQWFCSQFTRNNANTSIDQVLEVVDSRGEIFTILNRLLLFKNQEPDEGQHFAALADWWLSQNETKTAIEVLAKGREVAKHLANSKYLGSFSDAMLRQGELELVQATIDSWPEDDRELKYWRNLAVLRQNQASVQEQDPKLLAEAVAAFQKVTTYWSSSFDPNLFQRLGMCQQELGSSEEAKASLQRSLLIRSWMETRWPEVGKAMGKLSDRESLQVLIDFYTAIDCPEAVTYLTERVELLEKTKDSTPQ